MSTVRRSARLNAATSLLKYKSKPENEHLALSKPSALSALSKKRKAGISTASTSSSSDKISAPSTPKRQRTTKIEKPQATPAAISLMKVPYSTGDIDDSTPPPPNNRLVVAERSNAPLLTPETHHLVTNRPVDQVTPSKLSKIGTTNSILDEAIAHLLETEPKLKPVIDKYPCHVFSSAGLSEEIDPFRALVSGIIAQQVSGAAAKSIKAKFISLFHPSDTLQTFPPPSVVVSMPVPQLRAAGLSQRKAEYIFGLAEKFVSGEITTAFLFSASYDEIMEKLLKVRGLGRWSVEMFACFALKRLDVFSTGDLGVQRGMASLCGRDVGKIRREGGGKGGKGGGKWKYMNEKDMLEGAEKFRPFRSVFMWYMWRVVDVNVEALGG